MAIKEAKTAYSTAPAKRDTALDLLKIAGSILIVFHHYCQMTGTRFTKGINFLDGIFPFGYIVELFFLISGFLMYKYAGRITTGETGFRKFFISRYSRLIPLVAVSVISYALFDHYVFFRVTGNYFGGTAPTAWGVVLGMLGLQAGWTSETIYMINNPTWYVSVLLLCYVVFYFLTEICARKNKSPWKFYVIMALTGAVDWCISNMTGFHIPFLNALSARGFMPFFTGLTLANLLETKLRKRKIRHYMAAVCILIASFIAIKTGIGIFLPVFLSLLTYPDILFIMTGIGKAIPPQAVFNKPLHYLSSISYSVYIWHLCGLMVLISANTYFDLKLDLHSPVTMLIFTLIMEFASALSFHLIEKRINPRFEKFLTETFLASYPSK